MLADLYRRACTLASEETAQPGPAAALYEATAALFADPASVAAGESSAANDKRLETIRERIRRIAIVALRRQALAARQAWVDTGGPAAGADAQATALLAQALTFGEAALNLHRDGDPARETTRRVVAFLQSTVAMAKAPPKGVRVAQPAPAEVARAAAAGPEPATPSTQPESTPMAAPSGPGPTVPAPPPRADPRLEATVFIAGEPPAEDDEGKNLPRTPDQERSQAPRKRPAMVPVLAAITVAGFVAGFIVAPRIWRGGAATRPEVRVAQPAVLPSPAAQRDGTPAPGGVSAPNATARPVTVAPAGGTTGAQSPAPKATQNTILTPATPAKVDIVLRSEPSGAQVFIGGVWQGATPLRLEQPAGAVLRLTVRRGARVWRGTLQVGERSGQVLTIRLPETGPVTARSTPPPAPPTPAATPAAVATAASARAHFENLMVQGVELYRGGWYGPAMARFRAASAIRPDAPSPYLWYARAAVRVGRIAEARRALERVIAIAPTSSAAREAQALLNRLK